MTFWSIILLGLIEGITEFVPISSTGHLLLAEHWLGPQSDLFNVFIQCGAVLAVLPLFRERLWQFTSRWREPDTRDYMTKIAVAFFVTGVGGIILEKAHFKLPETVGPVGLALLIGGILFVLVERWLRGRKGRTEVTWSIALAVAIGQLIAAAFPGASRSGTTILAALILGLARPQATEFSFLVGIPTMLAAGGLKMFKALHHPPPGAPAENWTALLIGALVAAVVSFVVVKWFLRFVQSHSFEVFGWYRIVLGAAILLWLR